MAEAKLNVELIDFTQEALSIIYASCRQCYSSKFAGDIFNEDIDEEQKEEFVRKIAASGHESPLEHVKFTFAIQGVSRALTHQLVRHRIASYSQQSQRYVKEKGFDYIVPPSIEKNKKMKAEYLKVLDNIQHSYNALLELYDQDGIRGEKANEDARFVLPQAAETKIVVTMNARQLLHFFKERCCTRAQWEIRALANEMLQLCKEKLPSIFGKNSGPKCETLKFCPEGEKFACGKYPVLTEIK
ncbi:MAG: FAD-dependent thymidylate synthase [Candidatus Omnitrophica bacterium]|nr:FAD-dependent thymidylate synthase [Candidatus Omnitrophota bacterium]